MTTQKPQEAPHEAQIYGPYLPLTNDEIYTLEVDSYGGKLTDFERLVLQGTHQYRIRGEEYFKTGDLKEANMLTAFALDKHVRLVEIVSARN